MLARLAAIGAGLLLASCASQTKLAEADLGQIHAWLPGRYDNVEQAQDDARQGREPRTTLSLTIVPIDVPLISEHAFYLQESAADDPRRILTQRLLSFEVAKGGRIVQTVWSLAQPGRWRDAQLNPDLFKGMMFQDATRLNGCELEWKKEAARFVAANQPATCQVTSPALGAVRMQMRAELSAAELSMAELAFGAGDQVVQGNAAEPFYRYRKRSNP
jgi:hypothetical protein